MTAIVQYGTICLLPIKVKKTTVLPLVLHGGETVSL